MLTKLKNWGDKILAKIGVIGPEVEGFIVSAVKASKTLKDYLANKTVEVTVKSLFPDLTGAAYDQAVQGLIMAIKYLSQAENVVNAGTPDQMLQEFLKELQQDTPGTQETKIMRVAQEIVGFMHKNKWIRCVYDYLVQKYFTAQKVDKLP